MVSLSPLRRKLTTESASKTPWLIVFMLWLGTLLVALDVSIIGVALPKISTQFHALHDVGWYVSVYLLTLTAIQPFLGQIDKYFSPKLVYMLSIAMFEAGSAICGGARKSYIFIIGRAIAGVGAAGLYQGALAIINNVMPRRERPRATGIVMSVYAVALSFGPPLGGILVGSIGWRWCFLINLPIGGVVFLVILLLLKIPNEPHSQPLQRSLPLLSKISRLDFLGLSFLVGGCVCLFLALQRGLVDGDWKSEHTVGLFVGSGIMGVALVVHEWALGDNAMIPASVMGQRSILMASTFLGFSQATSLVLDTYLPFFFQDYQGVSPGISGARFLILIGPQILALVFASDFAARGGIYMIPMVFGQVVASISLSLLIFKGMEPHAPAASWAPPLTFIGLGIGAGVSMPFTAIQAVFVDPQDPRVALANGVVNFFGQFGAAIGVQIAQVTFLSSGGTSNVRVAVQHAMYVALIAALVALLAAVHMERRRLKIEEVFEVKPSGPLPESQLDLTHADVEQQIFQSSALESQASLISLRTALTGVDIVPAPFNGYAHELQKMPSRHLKLRAVPSARSELRVTEKAKVQHSSVEVDGSLGMMSTWDGTKNQTCPRFQTPGRDYQWRNEVQCYVDEHVRFQDADHGYSMV